MPKILIKRGTVSPGTTLDLGELAFRHDTNELFVGKGVGNQPVKVSTWKEYHTDFSILVANIAETPESITIPTNTVLGRSTGSITPLSGTAIWSIINGQNDADINVNNKRIINLVNPVDASDAATKSYVDNLVSLGLTFHEAVLTKSLSSPPANPTTGARYWIGETPSGDWSGHAYQIAMWNGTAWTFEQVTEGDTAYVIDESMFYFYDPDASGDKRRQLYTGIGNHAVTHLAGGSDPIDVKDLVDSGNNLLFHAFSSKGQILVGTGSGTWVALPVGSNGQFLVADSNEASGVKWATNVYTSFLSLTDTPSTYTGSENYFVKVNSTGTALEFTDVIDGGTL